MTFDTACVSQAVNKKKRQEESKRENNDYNKRCISGYALLTIGDYISYFLFREWGGEDVRVTRTSTTW